jgi:hypothetical protein
LLLGQPRPSSRPPRQQQVGRWLLGSARPPREYTSCFSTRNKCTESFVASLNILFLNSDIFNPFLCRRSSFSPNSSGGYTDLPSSPPAASSSPRPPAPPPPLQRNSSPTTAVQSALAALQAGQVSLNQLIALQVGGKGINLCFVGSRYNI